MQNHLLQILALFAMETPVSLDAEDIRNEKVFYRYTSTLNSIVLNNRDFSPLEFNFLTDARSRFFVQ